VSARHLPVAPPSRGDQPPAQVARGFSGWGGSGLLAGIGGAIAAAFSVLFGKKKDS
jgi:hypothetical protein